RRESAWARRRFLRARSPSAARRGRAATGRPRPLARRCRERSEARGFGAASARASSPKDSASVTGDGSTYGSGGRAVLGVELVEQSKELQTSQTLAGCDVQELRNAGRGG